MRMCSNFPLKCHRQLLPFLIQLQMQVLMLNPCNLADVQIMIEVTIVHSALSLLQVGHILFYFMFCSHRTQLVSISGTTVDVKDLKVKNRYNHTDQGILTAEVKLFRSKISCTKILLQTSRLILHHLHTQWGPLFI